MQGDKRIFIQERPILRGKKKVAKLGFLVNTLGEYTLQLEEEHINSKYYIYLKDKQDRKIIDIRSTDYRFNVDSIGENLNRFKLIYTKKKRNNA